ncbi:immunity repressor [Gordonia phage Thimann]|nr:immunity repressor [Gordonia phage Thimann]
MPKFFVSLESMNDRNSPDLARFGRVVRARREQLGLNQDELPSGPSTTTLTKIENGTPPAPVRATLRKLDVSLRWVDGSAQAVLDGGDPVPLPDDGQKSATHLPPHIAPTVTASIEFESAQPEMDYLLRLMREGRANEIPAGRLAELGETLTIERFVERFPHMDRALQLDIAEYAATAEYSARMHRLDLQKETPDDVTTEQTTEGGASEAPEGEKNGAADRRSTHDPAEVSTVQRDTDRSAGRRLDIVRPDESAREPKIRARAIRIEIDGSVHAEPEDIPVSASTLEEALQELLDRYTDQGFVVDTDDGVADTGADVFVHGERFDMVIELKDSDSQFRPSADLVEVAMRYVMNARNRDVQAASDAGARQSNYELANRRGGGTSEGRRRREEQDRDAERGEE